MVTELEQILGSERTAWQQLVALLEREQVALSQVDLTDLPDVTQQKNALVSELAQLGEQRNAYCQGAKVPHVPKALLAWLQSQQGLEEKRAAHAWQGCLLLAQQAMELNVANGSLLELKYKNNQQALNVLLALAHQNVTYDKSGSMAFSEVKRLVGLG